MVKLWNCWRIKKHKWNCNTEDISRKDTANILYALGKIDQSAGMILFQPCKDRLSKSKIKDDFYYLN